MRDETNKPPLSQDPDINPQAGSVDHLSVAGEGSPTPVEPAAEETNEE